jgi:hypothetical protein
MLAHNQLAWLEIDERYEQATDNLKTLHGWSAILLSCWLRWIWKNLKTNTI